MPEPTLVYKTAQRVAAEHLRAGILSGRLGPGTSISQDEVAVELGISRQPVREALRELATEGLLELKAHRSAVVVSLHDGDMEEIFGLRALLESKAVELAVPYVNDRDLVSLKQCWSAMEAAHENADAHGWLELNREFHELVIARCPWSRLRSMLEAQHNALAPYFSMWGAGVVTPGLLGLIPAFQQHHQEILQAIESHDGPAAADATRRHVAATSEHLRAVLIQLGEAALQGAEGS